MAITPQEFDLIRTFLQEHSGILIGKGKEYLVENRLAVLLVQNGLDNFTQLHQKLSVESSPLRAKVIDAMTTNETLWFRDASFFSALSGSVIPTLFEKAKTKPKVRVWSAACSTGQEPYSISMLLDAHARKAGAEGTNLLGKFEIMATDISPSAISIAKAGMYSQLAISRGMRDSFLERYFVKKGAAYEVTPEIRSRVSFKLFNLKDAFTPHGRFDFILCRNVLIYFSEELKRNIYDKMSQTLERDGLLAIGASESSRGFTDRFEQVMLGGAALLKTKR
ncbi:MAG: chemotaxis protein [Magnetococcales bacterium]|nr:chemotaxis protein [Magnetococcales bacterium]